MRTIKFINLYGDIVIKWDSKDDKQMEQILKAKLNQGFQFFIVKN